MDYLKTFQNKLVIDHYITHQNGNIEIQNMYNINISSIKPIKKTEGANSIILTFTKSDGKTAYIKIGHGQRQEATGPIEVNVDSMLMESILSNVLSREKRIAGIDHAWQMTFTDVSEISKILYNNQKIVSHSLYNAAIILEPTTPSTTFTRIKDMNPPDVISALLKTPLFENFIIDTLALGYRYGFVHNDLHAGNVLVLLKGTTITGYKIIDLGRAYISLVEVAPGLCKNEYAKLSMPLHQHEYYDSFILRVNKINTLIDCYNSLPENAWIKPPPVDEFRKKTYILFDLMCLLNGCGYYNGLSVKIYDISRDFINMATGDITIYMLLDFWYIMYTKAANKLPIFYEQQWLDYNTFYVCSTIFYNNLLPHVPKIEAVLKTILTPQMLSGLRIRGGSSSSKKNFVPGLVVTPTHFGEALLNIEDLKKQHSMNRVSIPKKSRSLSVTVPPQSVFIPATAGGKSKKRVSK